MDASPIGDSISRHLPFSATYLTPILTLVFFVMMGGLSAFAATDAASAAPQIVAGTLDEATNGVIFGLFMGIVLMAAAYLFCIWIVMRDRGQVSLICLLLCLGIYIASTNNLVMEPLGLSTAATGGILANYSLIFSCLFSVFFTYYFLEIDLNSPGSLKPMFVIGAMLLVLLVYSIFDQTLAHFALPAVCTLTIGIVISAGGVCLMRGVSGSFTHIITFIFFLAGVLAGPLYDLGYITHADSANDIVYGSFSMAALMFAIVIASQFAARQEEKEKALAISNERFSLATRGANEGLFDWNLTTGEVFFSEQFRKIIGLRLENKPQSIKTWIRLIAPADRRVVREAMRRFRHNREVSIINIEYRIAPQSGAPRWLHSKAVAVRDPATKKVVRLVGSTSDITARKQSEVALRASETRFRSITEAHPVPVMIVSLVSSVVLYASPGAEELLGLTQDKLVHRFFTDFLTRRNGASGNRHHDAARQRNEPERSRVATRQRQHGNGGAFGAAHQLSGRRLDGHRPL